MQLINRYISIFVIIISVTLISVLPTHAGTSTSNNRIVITVNDNIVASNIPPYINSDNRTMVPIRFIAEALHSEVSWDEASKKVTVKRDGNIVNIWLDKYTYTVNNVSHKMDTKPTLIDPPGRTFIPLRFAAEALGANVEWITQGNINYVRVNDNTYEPTSQQNTEMTAEEQQMINLVNHERTSRGLAPLKVSMELVKIARLKSQDMIVNSYFAHQSPTYGSPFEMMKQFGISFSYAAENLAGAPQVGTAHTNLMDSSGHRANILNSNYTSIGIGIVDGGKYGKMFTQHFTR